MSDTDSSDGENLQRLLEASDTQFLSNSLYKKNERPKEKVESKIKLPSLRRNENEDENYNFLRVTPGFRDHVAKILDKRMEQTVKYTNKIEDCNETKSRTKGMNDIGGVKLFRDSEVFLEATDQDYEEFTNINRSKKPKIKMRKCTEEESEDEESKVQNVAVSPEEILNQTGTEQWTYKKKVFNYKKSENGALVSTD